MKYYVEFSMQAIEQLKDMDRNTSAIILTWLRNYIENFETPRTRGRSLDGIDCCRWRYNIGKYRLLVWIDDDRKRVVVVWIGKSLVG